MAFFLRKRLSSILTWHYPSWSWLDSSLLCDVKNVKFRDLGHLSWITKTFDINVPYISMNQFETKRFHLLASQDCHHFNKMLFSFQCTAFYRMHNIKLKCYAHCTHFRNRFSEFNGNNSSLIRWSVRCDSVHWSRS